MNKKVLIVEDQFAEADYLRQMLSNAGYLVIGIARSVSSAEELLRKEKPDFVLVDIFLRGKETGIDLARKLTEDNIPFVYLSANSDQEVLNAAKSTQPYGFLVKPFREKDLLITLEIAQYRHEHNRNTVYTQEREIKKALREFMAPHREHALELSDLGSIVQPFIPFDYLFLKISSSASDTATFNGILRTGFKEYQHMGLMELAVITGLDVDELKKLNHSFHCEPGVTQYNGSAFESISLTSGFTDVVAGAFDLFSQLCLQIGDEMLQYTFSLFSRRPHAFTSDHSLLLEHLSTDIRNCIRLMMAASDLQGPETKPQSSVAGAARPINGFEDVVGRSHLMLNVFDQVVQVAGTGTSVLLLGETGTGKERIADSIHQLSARHDKPFVKINCATLPADLIESELFGHERGSYTGAHETRIGKFEKADGGTVFLDEIGEMPIELQVKLLRVLQEREIERLGGKGTISIDVRIIAATNRNLEKEVSEGRFRLDLYYRLNVFPITVPALRHRLDDLEVLTNHFIKTIAKRTGSKVTGINPALLERMMAYNWPGNVRELEHLIERNIILTKGTVIETMILPRIIQNHADNGTPDDMMKTIQENERDYIMAVLTKCKGRIWGPGGAAGILNIPPTTLKSKMQKLGIKKDYHV